MSQQNVQQKEWQENARLFVIGTACGLLVSVLLMWWQSGAG